MVQSICNWSNQVLPSITFCWIFCLTPKYIALYLMSSLRKINGNKLCLFFKSSLLLFWSSSGSMSQYSSHSVTKRDVFNLPTEITSHTMFSEPFVSPGDNTHYIFQGWAKFTIEEFAPFRFISYNFSWVELTGCFNQQNIIT